MVEFPKTASTGSMQMANETPVTPSCDTDVFKNEMKNLDINSNYWEDLASGRSAWRYSQS